MRYLALFIFPFISSCANQYIEEPVTSSFCDVIESHNMDCPSIKYRDPMSWELPNSPLELLAWLKNENVFVGDKVYGYVKESHIPVLVDLISSEEKCGFIISSASSYLPPSGSQSTIGVQAALLIESYWREYYPFRLVMGMQETTPSDIRHWYKNWVSAKKRAE